MAKFNAEAKDKIISMVAHGYTAKSTIVQQWVAAAGLPKEAAYHIYWRLRMPDQWGYIFKAVYHRMLRELVKQGGYTGEQMAMWTDYDKLAAVEMDLRAGKLQFIDSDFPAMRTEIAKVRPATLAKWI